MVELWDEVCRWRVAVFIIATVIIFTTISLSKTARIAADVYSIIDIISMMVGVRGSCRGVEGFSWTGIIVLNLYSIQKYYQCVNIRGILISIMTQQSAYEDVSDNGAIAIFVSFRFEINLGLLTGLRVLVSSPRALRLCCWRVGVLLGCCGVILPLEDESPDWSSWYIARSVD